MLGQTRCRKSQSEQYKSVGACPTIRGLYHMALALTTKAPNGADVVMPSIACSSENLARAEHRIHIPKLNGHHFMVPSPSPPTRVRIHGDVRRIGNQVVSFSHLISRL